MDRADWGPYARNKSLKKHVRVIKARCLSYLEPCYLKFGRTTSSDKPGRSHRYKEQDAETAVAAASSALLGGSPGDVDDQGCGVIVKIPVLSRHRDTVHDPETVIPRVLYGELEGSIRRGLRNLLGIRGTLIACDGRRLLVGPLYLGI